MIGAFPFGIVQSVVSVATMPMESALIFSALIFGAFSKLNEKVYCCKHFAKIKLPLMIVYHNNIELLIMTGTLSQLLNNVESSAKFTFGHSLLRFAVAAVASFLCFHLMMNPTKRESIYLFLERSTGMVQITSYLKRR